MTRLVPNLFEDKFEKEVSRKAFSRFENSVFEINDFSPNNKVPKYTGLAVCVPCCNHLIFTVTGKLNQTLLRFRPKQSS